MAGKSADGRHIKDSFQNIDPGDATSIVAYKLIWMTVISVIAKGIDFY